EAGSGACIWCSLSSKQGAMMHRVSSGGNMTNSVRAMNARAASDRKSQLHRESSQGQGRYDLQGIEDQLLALEARVFRLEDVQASSSRPRGSAPSRSPSQEQLRINSGALLLSHSSEPQMRTSPLSPPPLSSSTPLPPPPPAVQAPPPPEVQAPPPAIQAAPAVQAAPPPPQPSATPVQAAQAAPPSVAGAPAVASPAAVPCPSAKPQPVLTRRLLYRLLARLEALEGSSMAIWICSDALTAQLHTLQQQFLQQQQQQQQQEKQTQPSTTQLPPGLQELQGQVPTSSASTPEDAAPASAPSAADSAAAAADAQASHHASRTSRVSLDAEPSSGKPTTSSLQHHRPPQRASSAAELSMSGQSLGHSNQSSLAARGPRSSKRNSFRAYASFSGGDQDGHLNVGRLAMLLDEQHSHMVSLEERLEVRHACSAWGCSATIEAMAVVVKVGQASCSLKKVWHARGAPRGSLGHALC
ncbi:hypothetical protein DUNSADRAFT_10715, partial [Dunaliella salina]